MALSVHIPTNSDEFRPRILVCGVGGAGGNAINNMIRAGLEGVEFLVANTDAQDLAQSLCEARLQLGPNTTRGLGAGAQPDVGAQAAEESAEQFAQSVQGVNMAFIAAGMGGGTGTGAAPTLARVLREQGVLTVGVVTKPFQFEGITRMRLAEQGIKALQEQVDTLIVIPNQNLFRVANEATTFADAFRMADDVLLDGVRGVSDLIVKPGVVNLDFADVRSLMTVMGNAMMGTGTSEGDNRALEAAERAIANPLLDDMSLDGARGVLINVTGGTDLTLFEVDAVASHVREKVDAEANIIFGSATDEKLGQALRVSVLATGIDPNAAPTSPRPEPTPPSPPSAPGPGGRPPRGGQPYSSASPSRPSPQPPVFLRPPFGGRQNDPRGAAEGTESVAPTSTAPAASSMTAPAQSSPSNPLPPIAQRSEHTRQVWEAMTSGPVRPMQASGQGDPSYRPPQLTPQPLATAPEHRAEPYAPPAPTAAPAAAAPTTAATTPNLFNLAYDDQAVAQHNPPEADPSHLRLIDAGQEPEPMAPLTQPEAYPPSLNPAAQPAAFGQAQAYPQPQPTAGAVPMGNADYPQPGPQAPNLPFQADAGSAGRGQGGEGGFRAIGNFVRNTFNQLQPQAAPNPNPYDTPLPSTAPTRDFALQGQDSAGPDAQVPQRAQPHQYGLEDTSGFDLNDFDKTLNGVPDFLRRNNN